MNILVDENIPKLTVEFLRSNGHNVSDLRGTSDQGVPDPDVWNRALQEQALLITTDKGFTSHRSEQHFGILIICLRQPNLSKIHARVILAMRLHDAQDWTNLTLVMRDRVQSTYRYVADVE
jgi:predicted nuclease of predicted toxin-antitoxin system